MIQVGAEEIDSRGVARIEDVVNILPNVFEQISVIANRGGTSNGATGTSTLNLRGLGSNRTLVLIDGDFLEALLLSCECGHGTC